MPIGGTNMAKRTLKPRVCRACGRGGSLAAYAGRGYFHRACAQRWLRSGRMYQTPEDRSMTRRIR